MYVSDTPHKKVVADIKNKTTGLIPKQFVKNHKKNGKNPVFTFRLIAEFYLYSSLKELISGCFDGKEYETAKKQGRKVGKNPVTK